MSVFSAKNTVFVSIDATNSFLDKHADELYVSGEGTEHVAPNTKRIITSAMTAGYLTLNVIEEHISGHASFASSYTNKNEYVDFITYEEVKDWTETENNFSKTTNVNLKDLQEHLKIVGKIQLRPDHSIQGTHGAELTPPLENKDFSHTLVKGDKPHTHPLGPFEETNIDDILSSHTIKNIIMTGVATEFCIKKSAGDASKGFTTYLVTDAIAAVDDDAGRQALDYLTSQGVILITTNEILETIS